MRIAYLTNRYPAVSHSFIRREIEAVEAAGSTVFRFSVRAADAQSLPEVSDRAEIGKTVVLLDIGAVGMLGQVLATFARSPRRSFSALKVAFGNVGWSLSNLVRRAAYFGEAAALVRKMRSDRVDHLHAHFGTNPAMVARIANRLSGIPYSFTVHGPDEFDAPVLLDLRGKIADCAFCVAISNYGQSQLMRWSKLSDWSKIEVVRCGVDQAFLDDPTSPFSASDVPKLCTVARLSGQKGIPLLIEAAHRLICAGKTFTLTLVGDGDMRPEIEALIRTYALQNVVTITGWASSAQVVAHLRESRAMVLPSFAEGLPVVIMEAMALERPVIVTAIAGTPELVDENCGWLIPAGSIDALVDAMGAAIDCADERLADMGRNGRQRVVERHDARINGRHINAMFRRYHKGHGRCSS